MTWRPVLAGVLAAAAFGTAGCSTTPARRVPATTPSGDTGGIGQGAPVAASAGAGLGQAVTVQPPTPSAAQLLAGGDPRDSTVVGRVFALGSWSIDTTYQRGEVDAEARLVSLMTPILAAQVQAGVATVRPSSAFLAWGQHHATTVATVEPTHDSGAPPDTTTLAHRSFALAVTPAGSDGWTGPTETHVEFITLSRPGPGEPWRVADVQ
jgi:hypothetical protein